MLFIFYLYSISTGNTVWGQNTVIELAEADKTRKTAEKFWVGINGNKYTNTDSAFYYLERLRKFFTETGDTLTALSMHVQAAQIYLSNNNTAKAIVELETFIAKMQERKQDVTAHLYIELGNIYYRLKLYDNANENYHKALSAAVEGDWAWPQEVSINNIGMCLRAQGKNEEALKNFFRIYEYRAVKNKSYLGGSYNLFLIGETYRMMNNFPLARYYLHKGITLFNQSFEKAGFGDLSSGSFKADMLLELIRINAAEGNTDSMQLFFDELIRYTNQYNIQRMALPYYLRITEEWLKLGKRNEAKVCLKGYEANREKYKTLNDERDYARLKSEIAGLEKNKAGEMQWRLVYMELKDSITRQSSMNDLIELTSQALESRSKLVQEQQHKQIEQNNEIIKQEKTIRWSVLGIVAVLVIFLFIGYRLYNKSKYDNEIISKQNREKELLIREIHHRVKNNLTVVSSILDLQQREIKEEKLQNVFRDAKSRIGSMALVHKNLYEQDNFAEAHAQQYFENLFKTIHSGYKIAGKNITAAIRCAQVTLNIDTLIPLALITNELLTNSFKYAFEKSDTGLIEIDLKPYDEGYEFEYSDNGKGMDVKAKQGLGSSLIRGLCSQLNGSIERVGAAPGLKYSIRFKGINIENKNA